MKFLFLLSIGFLLSATASAQAPTFAATAKGQQVIRFDEAREALVYIVEGPADSSDVFPFKVTANNCTGKIDQPGGTYSKSTLKCRLEVPEMMVGFALIWSKHPDLQKIGKTVKSRDGQFEFRSFMNMRAIDYMLTPYLQQKEVKASQAGIEKRVLPRLVCDDYTWLPEPLMGADIARWSLVFPGTNPETQQLEPRPLIDTFGVKLIPEGKKMLFTFQRQQRIQNNDYRFQQLVGVNSLLPSLTYDGTPIQAHLSIQREEGDSCDATLSSDKYIYIPVNERVKEPTGDVPEFYEATKKPYIAGSNFPHAGLMEKSVLFTQVLTDLGPNGIE
ncbi:MAG: hypothetical protein ABL958_03680 [Bdellovibrionia bacterium]